MQAKRPVPPDVLVRLILLFFSLFGLRAVALYRVQEIRVI